MRAVERMDLAIPIALRTLNGIWSLLTTERSAPAFRELAPESPSGWSRMPLPNAEQMILAIGEARLSSAGVVPRGTSVIRVPLEPCRTSKSAFCSTWNTRFSTVLPHLPPRPVNLPRGPYRIANPPLGSSPGSPAAGSPQFMPSSAHRPFLALLAFTRYSSITHG